MNIQDLPKAQIYFITIFIDINKGTKRKIHICSYMYMINDFERFLQGLPAEHYKMHCR